MEDYEYLTLLASRIELLRQAGQTRKADRLAKKFKPYSAPGNTLVKDLVTYTDDPAEVERVRTLLADLIMKANIR